MTEIVVAALYRFTRFADPQALCGPLAELCAREGLRGTLLLATEGINGTVAGPRPGIDAAVKAVRALPGCAGIEVKESVAASMPFARLKVRVKREIVQLGRPGVDPAARPGTQVAPRDWNAVVTDPDTVVIDTRNAYEVAIGSFGGAIDPGCTRFGDFPDWWRAHRAALAGRRVAMFCTGGIRCEKAASFLLGEGVPEVLQLRGGILRYLEEVPAGESLWQGECFVFDGRVSVVHGMAPGRHGRCHACGAPVAPEDRAHPDFENGVSCGSCAGRYDAAQRAGFRERQRQIRLAQAKGIAHLGPEAQRDPDSR